MKKLKAYLKKKGFTLIELLAVTVILALIALITVPIVLNMINNAKKKSFEDSVLVTSRELDNYMINHSDFNYAEGETISVEQLKSVVRHSFKSGSFKIVNGKLEAYFITDGTYCAMGPVDKLEISKDCTSLDQTKPNIYLENLDVESNGDSVIVTLKEGLAEDIESGIKEYRVSLYNGETIVDTKTVNKIGTTETVTFNNLDTTKIYKIVLTVENGNGITNSVEVSLNKPTTQVNPSGWAQSKTVTIIYPTGYTNEYSIDGGTTWNTYENPIEVIENNKTIIARIKNGSNYVTSVTQTISGIDRSKPTAASVTKKETTSKLITVIASGTDNESDIYGYQFSKDNGQTWTAIQTSNEYTFNNLTSGTYNIKAKVINNTYSNNGINDNNSLVSSTNSISTNEIPTPTYSVSPSGWAQSKTVTIDYHDVNTYTHEYSLNGIDWQTYSNPIVFNQNGTVLARITDGTNYVSGSSYSVSGIDATAPTEATATIKTKTTSKVTVEATCTDGDSGITKIEYSNGGNWIDNGTNEHYTFTNLTAGTSYNFKVRCTNGSGLQKESETANGQTGSASIAFTPTRTPSNTTYATSVSVPVTYTIANVTTPTRYIRTSVDGTKLNINSQVCGTDSTPGTCTSTLNSNTAMVKDTWYKVDSNPTVTIAIDTDSVTLTALVHDGDSYLTSSTETITNIDTTGPSCILTVTTTDVSFASKTDNVEVTSYGMNKTGTAEYNSTSSLKLGTGTYYGYVKDVAGNIGNCSATVSSTYIASYNKSSKTCNKNESYTVATKICNKNTSYSVTTKTCNKNPKYTKTVYTCTNKKNDNGWFYKIDTVETTVTTCTSSNCGLDSTFPTICGDNDIGKTKTCCSDISTYSFGNETTKTGQSSCISSYWTDCTNWNSGNTHTTCTDTSTYSFGNTTTKTEQSSCTGSTWSSCDSSHSSSTHITCTDTSTYTFGDISNTTEEECNTNTFTCNENNSGKTYVTCTTNYACNDGTIKLNDSYCYKIN